MGYFSNGAEGMDYEEKYCSKCMHHEEGCAVWLAHMLYNYDECNKKNSILHILIPSGDRGENLRCKMFIDKPKTVNRE